MFSICREAYAPNPRLTSNPCVIDIGPNMKLILARMLGVMYINEALYFTVLSDSCLVDIYSASQYGNFVITFIHKDQNSFQM
jgi:hypothetical protein